MRPIGPGHRGQAAQVGQDGVAVGPADAGVVRVGKGRVEQMPVARAPFMHGPPEVVGGPGADAGGRVGCQIAAVDHPEWRVDRAAPRERGRVRRGMAGAAAAGPCQVFAAGREGSGWGCGRACRGGGRRGCRCTGVGRLRRPRRGDRPAGHRRRRDGGCRPGVPGERLRGEPGRNRGDVFRCQALRDLGHAVRPRRAALAGLPGAQLAVEIVARQAQQAGHCRLDSRERRAMAAAAGGNAAGWIAPQGERLAPLQ